MTTITAENQERAIILRDMGWSHQKIADEFGVTETTIRRWLNKPDPPAIRDQLEAIRLEKRQQYIEENWELVTKINKRVKEIVENPESELSMRDLVIAQGVYMDKIGTLESRRSGGHAQSPVNIMILPPNGNTTRVVTDAVRFPDESCEVLSDDIGRGSREDVLRLPEGDPGSDGESGEPGDDSSIDVS